MLDLNILSLMNETVEWERAGAADRYVDNAYAAPVTISCFMEPAGFVGGGDTSIRRPDDTVVDAKFDAHFDAADPNVQLFTTDDFFTIAGESGVSVRTQAERITNFYGPQGEFWTRVVSF